jgi:hypothetical protein
MTVASGLKSITVIDNQKYEFVDTFSAIGGSLTFTCVLPFNESWTPDLDFKLWQLERLGIEVLGELELPIDLDLFLGRVNLMAWCVLVWKKIVQV